MRSERLLSLAEYLLVTGEVQRVTDCSRPRSTRWPKLSPAPSRSSYWRRGRSTPPSPVSRRSPTPRRRLCRRCLPRGAPAPTRSGSCSTRWAGRRSSADGRSMGCASTLAWHRTPRVRSSTRATGLRASASPGGARRATLGRFSPGSYRRLTSGRGRARARGRRRLSCSTSGHRLRGARAALRPGEVAAQPGPRAAGTGTPGAGGSGGIGGSGVGGTGVTGLAQSVYPQ